MQNAVCRLCCGMNSDSVGNIETALTGAAGCCQQTAAINFGNNAPCVFILILDWTHFQISIYIGDACDAVGSGRRPQRCVAPESWTVEQ